MQFRQFTTTVVHTCLMLFILMIPFTDDTALLFLYAIAIPNMLLHWKFESNVCSLTLAEKFVGNKLVGNYDNCISCIVIDPLYNFPEKVSEYMNIVYAISIILWVFVIYKLYTKYKNEEITNVYDLFRSSILI